MKVFDTFDLILVNSYTGVGNFFLLCYIDFYSIIPLLPVYPGSSINHWLLDNNGVLLLYLEGSIENGIE